MEQLEFSELKMNKPTLSTTRSGMDLQFPLKHEMELKKHPYVYI